ncbi:MAG: PIN domain-containing protein [Anaerolineae bacterium]|nr:PIN domain-containing protein [Anaerolineae bacterium]
MTDYVTDTHSLIWYLEGSPRLGGKAKAAFEFCERGVAVIYMPTICLVEIFYLQEKGRIPYTLLNQFYTELRAGITGLLLADLSLEVIDALAHIARDDVPDMPDRIIAATAFSLRLPLITRDHKIVTSGLSIIW